MSLKCDNMDNTVLVRPVRLVPFDLGTRLSVDLVEKIRNYLVGKGYELSFNRRTSTLLKKCELDGYLCEDVRFSIFSSGIAVITILEDEYPIDDYKHFSISYNSDRKKAHSELFDWKHRHSELIRRFIQDVRSIVQEGQQRIRHSGKETFENQGMSYVMTVAFYSISGFDGQYSYSRLPDWFKRNVAAILDPALLYLEDSSIFSNTKDIDLELSKLIDEIDCGTEYMDYDTRNNITTLMSWSAVMIIGKPSLQDIKDYIDIEINVQSTWYYVYCLGHDTPRTLKEVKERKKSGVDIQKMINHLESISDELYTFDDSSVPFRYVNINRGMVQTSGLEEMIKAYQKKLRHLAELMSIEDRERHKKFDSTNEILLLIIASLQIIPIIDGRVSEDRMWLSIVVVGILILAGAIIVHIKNKEW